MTRMLIGKLALFALVMAAAGCATTAQLYVHQSPRFTQYSTFTLASADDAQAHFRRHPLRAEVATVVQNDLRTILTDRGYHADPAGELRISSRYGVGAHVKQEIPALQTDSTGANTETTTEDESGMDAPFQYTEAALVVDMFDGKTGLRVWHGVARELLPADGSGADRAAIERALRGMLVQFPIAATAVAR